MITESQQAWLLHKTPSGDTSLQVVLFTREHGLIKATLRGGRTPKKQAPLQLFTPLWAAWNQRRDWFYLHQLESTAPMLPLTGLALFASLYLNEILFYALTPQDAQPALFDVYQLTLHALASVDDKRAIETLLRRFEMTFLQSCGYFLTLTQEADSQKPIEAGQTYQYIPGHGFLPAKNGFRGADLLALAAERFEEDGVLLAAKRIMRGAVDHVLGGRALRTRMLFRGWG